MTQKEADLDEARRTIGILTKEKEQLREKVSDMEEEKFQMTSETATQMTCMMIF